MRNYRLIAGILLIPIIMMLFLNNTSLGAVIINDSVSYQNHYSTNIQVFSEKFGDDSTGKTSFGRRYGPWIIAAAAGIPLFAADKDVKKYSQRTSLHSKAANNFFKPVHDVGQGYEYTVIVPFAIYGLAYKNRRTLIVAEELIAGLVAVGVATEVFKITSGRLRPYQSNSSSDFFHGGRSFFSGDVSTSMTFATIMAKNYPHQNLGFIGIHHDIPLFPIVLYSSAGLVACQRLYSNNHWLSDVYFGGLAGFAIGSLTFHYGKKVHLKGLSIEPGRPATLSARFSIN